MAIRIKSMVMGPVATNCYYFYEEGNTQAVVIDPPVKGEWIHEHLKGRGLSVAAILFTHGHFDHISGANELRDASGAKICAPLPEQEMLEDPSLNLSDQNYSVRADRFLSDGEELLLAGINVRVIFTPGHTSGGCCYYLENEKTLFSGDTLFAGSVGRTDLQTGSHAQLIASVKEKLMVLPDDVNVYPGHGESTSIGEERKYNPFL